MNKKELKKAKVRVLTKLMRRKRKNLVLPFLKKEWRILDCACGDGWLTEYLKELGYDCYGVDINLNGKCENDAYKEADAKDLPFNNDFFDCILSFHTLEHVKCENEFKRVLKNGGLLIAECPNTSDKFSKILYNLKLISGDIEEHIRFMDFYELPFKLIKRKTYALGTLQYAIFKNKLN